MAPACRECFPHYYDWSSTYANVGHDAAMGEQLNGARIVTPFGIVTYSSTDAQPRARSVAQENEDENSCDDDPLVHQVNRQVTEEYSRTQEPYNRVGIQLPDEERGEVCSISSSVALAVDEVNRQIRSEMPLKGLCGGPCLQSPKHDDFQTTMPLVPSVHRGQDLRDEGLLEEKQVVPGSTGLRCCEPEFVRVPPEMERQRSSRLLQAISPRNMCSNVFEDVQPDFMAEYDVPIPA
ncbi:hypothetical protein GNI_134730 [Gregarina niphandrodes]|uniref:Uncharacterized protein n=1 Tax=Gregarina niphandrodes TaxID=110365 RepID=A0A023B182_GRENI|nr:hypothetical protein GNI_134730 [Gregarina niphandrodes]EZG46153.1 hypothetical protein GNI_134730 [Gregarina niphandrodes]|eukprot:XP_011132349.1 hypothetical protein GNI_134730 [Gregarina niphandrodes]